MELNKVSSSFTLCVCVCDAIEMVLWIPKMTKEENASARHAKQMPAQSTGTAIVRVGREMNFIQMADFDAIVNCCEWHVRVYDLGIYAFYYAIAHRAHTHTFQLIRLSVLRFMLCFLVCFLNVLCVCAMCAWVLFYLFIPSLANVFFVYHTQSHKHN